MSEVGTMRKNVTLILSGVLLCALIIGAYTLYRATDAPVESRRVDDAVASADQTIEEARRAREIHERETVERVVVIRGEVRQEVLALDPDGLAAFARSEIEEFRRRASGGDLDPSAAGMDGGD
jgi:hypothetical protein